MNFFLSPDNVFFLGLKFYAHTRGCVRACILQFPNCKSTTFDLSALSTLCHAAKRVAKALTALHVSRSFLGGALFSLSSIFPRRLFVFVGGVLSGIWVRQMANAHALCSKLNSSEQVSYYCTELRSRTEVPGTFCSCTKVLGHLAIAGGVNERQNSSKHALYEPFFVPSSNSSPQTSTFPPKVLGTFCVVVGACSDHIHCSSSQTYFKWTLPHQKYSKIP